VNIYTGSKHAFATLHVHGATYKERGLLIAWRKEIKNKEEILQLLEAVWEPSHVAIIHCRGHERGIDYINRGNSLADKTARRAAEELSSPGVLKQTAKLLLPPELPLSPNYTKEEEQWAKDEKGINKNRGAGGSCLTKENFVPSAVVTPLVKQHELTHLGKMALEKLLDKNYFIPKLPTLGVQISARCITCAQNNASQGPKSSPEIQTTGTVPFEDLGVDFTESCLGYWYLLVLVCIYSGWVEAYPTHREHMRSSKGPFKRNYPQMWVPPFHWIKQQTSLHGGNSPGPG
jgi:hypothetical protein